MRIENSANRNTSNIFQKKGNAKKEEKKQRPSNRSSDQLDLSASIVLLNHLLDASEHQYNPLPFYFSDAAAINAQSVRNISQSIQQKARVQDIDLNYDMISDMVISHANEMSGKGNNSLSQTTAYQHIALQTSETNLFERLHNAGLKQGLSSDVISTVVIAYYEHVRNQEQRVSNPKTQTHLLIKIINDSDKLQISNNKNLLVNLLENTATPDNSPSNTAQQ